MKILKKGKLPSEIVYNGVCYTCKTEVEFLQSEAESSTHYNETTYTIPCPLCTSTISGYEVKGK